MLPPRSYSFFGNTNSTRKSFGSSHKCVCAPLPPYGTDSIVEKATRRASKEIEPCRTASVKDFSRRLVVERAVERAGLTRVADPPRLLARRYFFLSIALRNDDRADRILQIPNAVEMNRRPRAKTVENGVQGGNILLEKPVRRRAHLPEPYLDLNRRLGAE